MIVGFFDTTALFCGSRDMIHVKGQGNETAFCTLTGECIGMHFTSCCIGPRMIVFIAKNVLAILSIIMPSIADQ